MAMGCWMYIPCAVVRNAEQHLIQSRRKHLPLCVFGEFVELFLGQGKLVIFDAENTIKGIGQQVWNSSPETIAVTIVGLPGGGGRTVFGKHFGLL